MTLKDSALDPLTILIRCDASHQLGFGHVVRCLALADELSESYGCSVSFAMREDNNGFKAVREKGYSVITPINTEAFDYKTWIKSAIHDTEAKALILDIRDDLPREVLKELKSEKNILLVTIDDPSDRRLNADLAFYPPVPQVQQMDWTGFKGKLFVGWEWVPLRKEFSSQQPKKENEQPVVLVTMGGSDPEAMTLKTLQALDLFEEPFATQVVIGPGFTHKTQLDKLLLTTHRSFEIKEDVKDMAGLMARADLAVASFGVTAYELAALGVPAIYLCLTSDHVTSASPFVHAQLARCLGRFDQVSLDSLQSTIKDLLFDKEERNAMGERATRLVDGQGASRIARIIMERIGRSND
jgi:spore coat polysaccharide biosynthesis protein SpsF